MKIRDGQKEIDFIEKAKFWEGMHQDNQISRVGRNSELIELLAKDSMLIAYEAKLQNKAMAKAIVDNWLYYACENHLNDKSFHCIFCTHSAYGKDNFEHAEGCIVLKAEKILKEG